MVFNAGTFDAAINDGETFAIRTLTQNGSSTRLGGVISITEFSNVGLGGIIHGGSATGGQGRITSVGAGGTLTNQGTIAADLDGGVLQIDTLSFTNQGVVSASNGAILFQTSQTFTNLSGGVLTGGTYRVSGNGTAIDLVGSVADAQDGRVVTNNATITLDGPGAYLFGHIPGTPGSYDALEATLTTIGSAGGVLNILGGRDYATALALTNSGTLTLGGGTLSPAALTNNGFAYIVGNGTIMPTVLNGGQIEAQGGTLVLAGGLTNTGFLQVDPHSTLVLQGTFTGLMQNNGTVQVPGGTLTLSGGVGDYFIEGGTPGAVTTLNLIAAGPGEIAFNGANGRLVLSNPNTLQGSIVGFGTGDTIDLHGIVSNGATLSGNTLNITNAGTTVFSLPLQGDYSTASFAGASDGAGGTRITVSGVEPRDFVVEGPRWADKTITWSLAQFQYSQDTGTSFSTMIDPTGQSAFVGVIRLALDTWASIGGFTFVQQPDASDPSLAADLRFGWGSLLGSNGEIGQASFTYFGTIFQPDVVIRLQDPAITALVSTPGVTGGLTYQGLSSTFYQIVVHEIGHALGIGHSTDTASVMYPSATGVHNQAPDASDIAAIHAIYDSFACFAAGTHILTAAGPVAVERLAPGDLVPTLGSGRLRRVGWIGHRTVQPARHPRPGEVMPVQMEAGAFGPDMPLRDLLLSPDHAVFIADAAGAGAGVLVPIRHLANGASIRQVAVDSVTYFHVELAGEDGAPAHDVLLAEGLPAESYLDTGNRGAFANAPCPALHPDFARRAWDSGACAPLHEGGRRVAAEHARLKRRAALLGHARTDDPGLHVRAAGRTILPARDGEAWVFDLPAGTARLLSRSGVPAEFDPASQERRRLGVALRALLLDGAPLGLDDPRLGGGLHAVEGGCWRWTDGAALVTLDAPGRLEIRLGPAIAYWLGSFPAQLPGMGRSSSRQPAMRQVPSGWRSMV